ncbi:Plasma protease C1 inhibitor [Apodemus speciosus]|uniref:Plasma protease C1 inhibitor n=1 Tax=Apodemus speciosus TaxID=105296 RepID=A0ABQ0EI20_APOSI
MASRLTPLTLLLLLLLAGKIEPSQIPKLPATASRIHWWAQEESRDSFPEPTTSGATKVTNDTMDKVAEAFVQHIQPAAQLPTDPPSQPPVNSSSQPPVHSSSQLPVNSSSQLPVNSSSQRPVNSSSQPLQPQILPSRFLLNPSAQSHLLSALIQTETPQRLRWQRL